MRCLGVLLLLLAGSAWAEDQEGHDSDKNVEQHETGHIEPDLHTVPDGEVKASSEPEQDQSSAGTEGSDDHGEDGNRETSAATDAEPIHVEDILKPPAGIEALALTLMRLQDSAASGRGDALRMQRKVLSEMSRHLRMASPHDLPSQRTLRAAIIYLLGGGRARDARTLLAATPETEPLRWILKGAAHYAANEQEDALAAFLPFDPERLPASIGGRVALARAMVLPAGQEAERIRLLRMAGRLMPGTLVEESALRRLFALATKLPEPAAMQFISEKYVERYSRSLFAAGVFDAYARAVVAFEELKKPVDRKAVELWHNRLPPERRRLSYLQIARQSVVRGLSDLALFCATRARRLAMEGSDDWHLATLLDAAILITTTDYDIAADLLRQVDPAKLDSQSRELLDATRRIADTLRMPAMPGATESDEEPELSEEQAQLRSKAEKLLSSSDELLASMTQ